MTQTDERTYSNAHTVTTNTDHAQHHNNDATPRQRHENADADTDARTELGRLGGGMEASGEDSMGR